MGPSTRRGTESAKGGRRGPEVRVRAWIEWDGEAFIGPGRATLLDGIERLGSISKAAQELGVTYRTAWKWIGIMNRAANHPLVEAAPGGRGGGGARLTDTGRAVLEAHRRLATGLDAFVAAMNGELRQALPAPGPRQRRST